MAERDVEQQSTHFDQVAGSQRLSQESTAAMAINQRYEQYSQNTATNSLPSLSLVDSQPDTRLPYNKKELGGQILLDNFDKIDIDHDGFLRSGEIAGYKNSGDVGRLGKSAIGRVQDDFEAVKRGSNDQVGREIGASKEDLQRLVGRNQRRGELRGYPSNSGEADSSNASSDVSTPTAGATDGSNAPTDVAAPTAVTPDVSNVTFPDVSAPTAVTPDVSNAIPDVSAPCAVAPDVSNATPDVSAPTAVTPDVSNATPDVAAPPVATPEVSVQPPANTPSEDNSAATQTDGLPFNKKELGAKILQDNFKDIDLDGDGFLRAKELTIFSKQLTGKLEKSAVNDVREDIDAVKKLSNDQTGKEAGLSSTDLSALIEKIQRRGELRGYNE